MYPALALQVGQFQALLASSDLATAMGGTARAYDRVPPVPAYPYVHIPEAQILDDGNACDDDCYEAISTIHVWSRAVGQVEAKRVSAAIVAILREIFTLSEFEITVAQFQNANHFTDADGTTAHSVLTFRYLLQTA